MFRELIRLRTSTSQLLSEKRDLRLELAMLRGELELARCQPPQSNSNHPATLVHKQAKLVFFAHHHNSETFHL